MNVGQEIRYADRSTSHPVPFGATPPNFLQKSSFPSGERAEMSAQTGENAVRFHVNDTVFNRHRAPKISRKCLRNTSDFASHRENSPASSLAMRFNRPRHLSTRLTDALTLTNQTHFQNCVRGSSLSRSSRFSHRHLATFVRRLDGWSGLAALIAIAIIPFATESSSSNSKTGGGVFFGFWPAY
jgi:hypothetical protein